MIIPPQSPPSVTGTLRQVKRKVSFSYRRRQLFQFIQWNISSSHGSLRGSRNLVHREVGVQMVLHLEKKVVAFLPKLCISIYLYNYMYVGMWQKTTTGPDRRTILSEGHNTHNTQDSHRPKHEALSTFHLTKQFRKL